MRQQLLSALALSTLALAGIQTPAFSETLSSQSVIPLGSETLATIACGQDEQLEILPTDTPSNQQNGYDRLTAVCQKRTAERALTSQPLEEAVRTTIFFCAVPGEYVYPLYTESSGQITCICLPKKRLKTTLPRNVLNRRNKKTKLSYRWPTPTNPQNSIAPNKRVTQFAQCI